MDNYLLQYWHDGEGRAMALDLTVRALEGTARALEGTARALGSMATWQGC